MKQLVLKDQQGEPASSIIVSSLHMNEFHSESVFISPICESNKVNLGSQLTQSSIQYCTVTFHTHLKKKPFSVLQDSTLKSTIVQYKSWHTGAGIKWTGKKSYWLEKGVEEGDDRPEGLSAIGDGEKAAVSLMPDDGTVSRSWLDSIIYPLEKAIQWCLGSSSFFRS